MCICVSVCVCVCVCVCACVRARALVHTLSRSVGSLCNPMDHQAPLSMEFSRQESLSGLPCSTPGDLPDPGITPASLASPVLVGRFFPTEQPESPRCEDFRGSTASKTQGIFLPGLQFEHTTVL